MKKIIIGLLALTSISAFAGVEIKTSQENIVRLNITSTGSNGLDECNSQVADLVSRLEKSNKVILRSTKTCSEEYKYEVKDGTIARYNGSIEYLKY